MIKSLFILFLASVTLVEVWAQDSIDFLDKVNEKPKTVVTQKSKDEVVLASTKKIQRSKRKKAKKKNLNVMTNTVPSLPINPVTNVNPITTTEIKPVIKLEVQPALVAVSVEEEIALRGLWIEPEILVEPDGLPGFVGDLVIGKSLGNDEKVIKGVVGGSPTKPLFSFSEFFEKYKKAMLILGILLLFAFYRLRASKPSSNSRPYRR